MKERGRLGCGRETNCEVREDRDNAGLGNMRSQTEWEIKRDKEKGDTDTTDKQTDGHCEQSAITLHLTGESSNTNSKPPQLQHSSISASLLCLNSPIGVHCNPSGACQASLYPFSLAPSVPLSILPSNSWDLIFPSQSFGPVLTL